MLKQARKKKLVFIAQLYFQFLPCNAPFQRDVCVLWQLSITNQITDDICFVITWI